MLLRQALEASDVERRHIASDLHDGVVQDLAGVAYALSAEARRTDSTARSADDLAAVEASASTVRASIRALRSLVVDIYPPDFEEVSLDSALSDLVTRAGEQGLDAAFDATGIRDPLPDSVARLLYRAAQEGLRNVTSHADAKSVRVRVASEETRAVIEVVDDGRGFNVETAEAARLSGHLGLTALRGLIADAGGIVEIETKPGAGTTLHVEMPL